MILARLQPINSSKKRVQLRRFGKKKMFPVQILFKAIEDLWPCGHRLGTRASPKTAANSMTIENLPSK